MRKFAFFIFILLVLALGIYVYYSYYNVPEKEKPLPPKITKPSADVGLLKLASWNIRIFSKSRNDKELQEICKNLINYDFTAIIELRDEEILKRTENTLAGMGRNYDYQISNEVGRGVKERYAFLYDKAKVALVTPGKIYSDKGDNFIREPYYASFRSGKFDFTIIATHIVWGDKISERRAEIQKLAEVYKKIQNDDPSEQDVILVGDFNSEPDDEKAFSRLRSIPSMVNLFDLPQKTVIFDSNLYDNIWFQSKYVKEYNGQKGINKFDETDFGNNDKKASLAVSDHRPVWAEFNTTVDDD
jgi:endonuclease/exonuclease/phosphatase family metal-dependent hydrolase